MTNSADEVRWDLADTTAADPDMALIMLHLMDELPPEERRAFDERIRTDLAFRARAERMKWVWSRPQRFGHTEADDAWLDSLHKRPADVVRLGEPRRGPAARSPWLLAASVVGVALVGGGGALVMKKLSQPRVPAHPMAASPAVHDPTRLARSTGPAPTTTLRERKPEPPAKVAPAERVPAAPTMPALGPVQVAGARPASVPTAPAGGAPRVNVDAVCDSARVRAFAAGQPPRDTGKGGAGIGGLLGGLLNRNGAGSSVSPVADGRMSPSLPAKEPKARPEDVWTAAKICDSLLAAARKP